MIHGEQKASPLATPVSSLRAWRSSLMIGTVAPYPFRPVKVMPWMNVR